MDEIAHYPAGISHLRHGHFRLYQVNPPLVRMAAAIPAVVLGTPMRWAGYLDAPDARPEFPVGVNHVRRRGVDVVREFMLARWACLPFTVLGAWTSWKLALRYWGQYGGLLALSL